MPTIYIPTRRGRVPVPAPLFFDDFTGTSINTSKWIVIDRISDQSNGEVNCMVSANVSVSGGLLLGLSKFEDHTCGDSIEAPVLEHYTSWQIQQATPPFLYGTVSARMKLPGGTGIWPTLFLTGFEYWPLNPLTANPPTQNWPHAGWCEIDIAEFLNNARTTVNCEIHFETPNVGPGLEALPFDATTRFMVYRFQWSAGSAIWSVDAEDGVGFRTLGTTTGANVPNVPMFLNINAAIGGLGGGTPNSSTFPQTFQIDWVLVTQ